MIWLGLVLSLLLSGCWGRDCDFKDGQRYEVVFFRAIS